MARINVEDRLWEDPRYENLVAKIGEEKSIAQLIKLWKLGQKFWIMGQKLIPDEVYQSKRFSKALIESEFVVKTDSGYYVKGAKRRFGWLLQKIEAGKLGGRPKKQETVKNQSHKKSGAKAEPKAERNLTESGTQSETKAHPNPPYSFLLSPSLRQETTKQETSPSEMVKAKPAPIEDSAWCIAIFCREYKRRYGTGYRVTGKEIGLLKTIVKDLGPQVYERMCRAFVDMADPWFITKRHDVTSLHENLAKVSQFEQSGKHVSQSEIRDIDRKAGNKNLLAKVERGEI